jgi:hypothetical protein
MYGRAIIVSMKGVTRRLSLPVFLRIFLLLLAALPRFAHAQVVISEIMYNPKGTDTGREWIELYNAGSSDVAMAAGSGKGGWRVNDGSNHTLTDPAGGTGRGTLTIPAAGYLVIASDPSDFTSGEYAGGSYSVIKSSISLNNTGTTVSIVDGTGATLDSVPYTSAQGANDDGTSLQKTADGSWIAALPTPGTANATAPYVAPVADTSSTSQGSDQSSQSATTTESSPASPAAVSSYVPPPTPDLYADAGSDRSAIVGADTEFDASAYDKTQQLIDPSTVRFSWNFGDGSTAEGEAVEHHFSYPGRYAVVLDIAKAKNAASDELTVTAEPAALSFDLLQDGGVRIDNFAAHDLDLSGWIVREDPGTFSSQFMLPDHSEILSGSSMSISAATLQFRASSSTMLEYPNGVLALAAGYSSASSTAATLQPAMQSTAAPSASGAIAPTPSLQKQMAKTSSDPSAQTDDTVQEDLTDADSTNSPQETSSTSAQTASAAAAFSAKYIWWLGALALALVAAAAIIAAGRIKKGEWDIVEEKED